MRYFRSRRMWRVWYLNKRKLGTDFPFTEYRIVDHEPKINVFSISGSCSLIVLLLLTDLSHRFLETTTMSMYRGIVGLWLNYCITKTNSSLIQNWMYCAMRSRFIARWDLMVDWSSHIVDYRATLTNTENKKYLSVASVRLRMMSSQANDYNDWL